MVDCLECQIRPVFLLRLSSDQIEVLVPSQTKIEFQVSSGFPVILEIEAKHLGSARQIKIGIAGSCGHATNQSSFGESPRQSQDLAGFLGEIDLKRWVELKETTEFGFP